MSKKEILNNIAFFLETLLPNASSSNKWTEESVKDAFSWAEYCRKVHGNVVGKPTEKAFDSQIRAIGDKLEGNGNNICLDYLQFSSKLLFKAFLQNIFVGPSIHQFIIDEAKRQELDVDELTEEVERAKTLCSEILCSSDLILNSKINYISVVDEVKAAFLLNQIKEKVNQFSTQLEVKKVLFDFFNNFLETRTELVCFMTVLLLNTEPETQEHLIQEMILRYTCDRIAFRGDWLGSSIWKLPCSFLSSIASKHCVFYKLYIKMLVDSSQQMVMTFKDKMLVWRMRYSPNLDNITFDEVSKHFRCLVRLPNKAGKSTQTLLQCLATNPKESAVWRDIYAQVNERGLKGLSA